MATIIVNTDSDTYDNDVITDVEQIYNKYVDMIYRIAFNFLKNPHDTQDAVQSIFYKIIDKKIKFKSNEHMKAWLIRAMQNHCINVLKSAKARNSNVDISEINLTYNEKSDDIIQDILTLPEIYKIPIYLYYYEGYSLDEIAKILKLNPSTLRSRIKNARKLLKIEIERED